MVLFQMLPFVVAMHVAMENGVHVAGGYQFAMWLAFVGGMIIEMVNVVRKR